MYIWILLATIMVALSFLNTSPREDKSSVFAEMKASTVINRFRAEHLAFFRGTECQILYQNRSANFDRPRLCEYGSSDETACTGDYTTMEKNLPVGYDISENVTSNFHAIYCFDRKIGQDASASVVQCGNSRDRYAISFAQIPERWISKTKTKVTMTEGSTTTEVEVVAPLPSFTNFLAKELSGVKNMGWMWCDNVTCHLVGRSAIQTAYEKINKGSVAKYVKFVFPNALFATTYEPSAKFKEQCQAGTPCLFAMDRYRTSDVSRHCATLKKNNNNQE